MFRPITLSTFVLALAVAASPVAVMAQEAPQQIAQQAPSQDQVVKGRIASIDSKFAITVNDERGYTDNVQLHQGTIINPTGLTLAPGMTVSIAGYNAGTVFAANQIDTPYTYSGPPPTPVYYGPGWWYPGFAYGYGPSFSLFVNVGAPFVAIARPWYGFWYVNPYVVPWVGYRAPWPAPYAAYRNVTVNNYYGAWNGSRTAWNGNNGWNGNHNWSGNTWQNGQSGQYGQNHTTVPPNEMRSGTTPQSSTRSAVPAPGYGASAPSYGRSAPTSAYRAQTMSGNGGSGHYGGGHAAGGGHGGGGGHR